jgi:AraC family transcriptional regulator, activator of mtrCDE
MGSDVQADIFAGLSPLLRVRPELQELCQFGAQWASPHEPAEIGWAPFHVITHGECLLDVAEHRGVALKAGDVVVLPHGGVHTIRAASAGGVRRPLIRRQLDNGLLLKTNVEAEGEAETQLICGRLRFDQAHDNMVLAALPSLVVVDSARNRDAARIRQLVAAMREELQEDRLGAVTVASDLATALVTIVLRAHFEHQQASPGVLSLMTQRQTGRVLAAMLADPARPWTLDELAAEAATSRATLVRLFQKATGAAPLAFLAELRLSLAQRRLVSSRASLAEIAEEAGYQSESAFSRAYSRRFGVTPGAARKGVLVREA